MKNQTPFELMSQDDLANAVAEGNRRYRKDRNRSEADGAIVAFVLLGIFIFPLAPASAVLGIPALLILIASRNLG